MQDKGGDEMTEYKITIELFGIQKRITIKAETRGEAIHKLKVRL